MDNTICRTMFCPKCFATGHPTKKDSFVVYGSSAQALHPRFCHSYGVIGFTPHIITFKTPLKYTDEKIQLTVCCGVCEVEFKYKGTDILYHFKNARFVYLTKEDFLALLTRWIRTGYEII